MPITVMQLKLFIFVFSFEFQRVAKKLYYWGCCLNSFTKYEPLELVGGITYIKGIFLDKIQYMKQL